MIACGQAAHFRMKLYIAHEELDYNASNVKKLSGCAAGVNDAAHCNNLIIMKAMLKKLSGCAAGVNDAAHIMLYLSARKRKHECKTYN